MGKWIQAKQGDTLLSLANEYHVFHWETIWNHANNADLKSKRANPQVLQPDDRIYIPGLDELQKPTSKATGARYRFRRKTLPSYFSVYLKDECGQPYAGCRYELQLGDASFAGKTDDNGLVCHPTKPDVETGKLTLWRSDAPGDSHTWDLKIGYLNPCDTVAGAKARLRNLGYLLGPVDDNADAEFTDALKNFQSHLGQTRPTGELDDATKAALVAQQNAF